MKKFSLKTQVHLPFDRVAAYLNSLSPREKNMMIGFFFVFLAAADYFLILSPTLALLQEAAPKASQFQRAYNELVEDRGRTAEIRRKWEEMHALVAERERAVIPSTAAAALLESLSKLAQRAGVKITSVKPAETGKGRSTKLFSPLPIQLSGVAGAHELGNFLSHLESGDVFFRVTGLSIASSPANERRHKIEMSLEACKKEASPASSGAAA